MAGAPIAIVGMACRLPGAIADPEALWQLCREGRSVTAPYGAERAALVGGDATWAPPGAYLGAAEVAGFDADFFAIAPREAAAIDPQQRLLLAVAWEALERAGLAAPRLAALRAGVFVGLMGADYAQLAGAGTTGVDAGLAAGRISHLLGLRGPSLTVSAACASGLAAVHLGCLSLRAGESDIVVAGGANIILSADRGGALARLGALSPDGRCRSFDAAAGGFGRAEGCAVVVLRRLTDALADDDRVDAVLHGSALNHNGGAGGLLLPSGPAQQDVIRAALRDAGVEPAQISYVEAHGSATPLGDAIEAGALAAVFTPRDAGSPLAIGSVKASLGHLEAAAGVVSLLKVALALRAREIPPLAGLQRASPHLPPGALELPRRATPWPAPDGAPLAGVSAFSLSGTNAHVVVGAGPAQAAAPASESGRPELLLVSARDDAACEELADRYLGALAAVGLQAACRTAARHRTHHEHRMALVGESGAQLGPALARRRAHGATRPAAKAPVLVFSGLGTQWPGMGAELLRDEPAFRTAVETCEDALRGLGGGSVLATLREGRDVDVDEALPALTALQLGLAALWRDWALSPGAVVGYSSGEIAAACVAGILTTGEALSIAHQLGRRLAELPRDGAMVAVELPADDLAALLARTGAPVSIAAVNSPASTTLSGDCDGLAALLAALRADGVPCFALAIDRALHGPAVEEVRDGLVADLATLAPRPARLPFVSTVTGRVEDGAMLGAEHWWRVARRPVELAGAVDALIAAGHTTFLELGAQPALGLSLQQCLSARGCDGAIVTATRRTPGARRTLLAAAARLYELGHDVAPYEAGRPAAGLPTYPWRLARQWSDPMIAPTTQPRPPLPHGEPWPRHGTLAATIAEQLGDLLGVAPDELDRNRGFFDLGATSVTAVALTEALEAGLGVALPRTLLFDYPTIALLAGHLAATQPGAAVAAHADGGA